VLAANVPECVDCDRITEIRSTAHRSPLPCGMVELTVPRGSDHSYFFTPSELMARINRALSESEQNLLLQRLSDRIPSLR
jgi:hypothetical protein